MQNLGVLFVLGVYLGSSLKHKPGKPRKYTDCSPQFDSVPGTMNTTKRLTSGWAFLLSAVRLDVLPAVDVDFRAIHVGCAAGAEEVDQRSDLLRPAEAVQRDAALDDLLGARRQDRGVDLPGAMAFTRTPCGPKSWAISRVSADNAALEVA